MKKFIATSLFCLLALCFCYAHGPSAIGHVQISRAFLNTHLGDRAEISFVSAKPGELTVQIVDRDGYLVRSLAASKATNPGENSFKWDGRNDDGAMVANEAYSLRITLDDDIYFPANDEQRHFELAAANYNSLTGLLAYNLDKPCRVHAQAGVATIDRITKKPSGPVMKTIVNREPRTAGRVLERWNGMDESGTIYIPDLKNFVVAVAATELPENSIITVGNDSETFLDTIAKRKGNSLFIRKVADHYHHQGLDAMNDKSPTMILHPAGATWSETEHTWITAERPLDISGLINGPSAKAFSQQPGKLMLFVDGNKVQEMAQPSVPFSVRLDGQDLEPGPHIVSIDWASDYGPTACNSFRLKLEKKEQAEENKR